jgi:GyrI-like small molecule binding domain
MDYTVTVETVAPRILAASRRHIPGVQVPTAFRGPLDAVWAYLNSHPGLRTDGENIFLYHHASGHPASGLDVDFGVEVTRRFAPEGEIICVETPGGRAAVVVHRGSYTDIPAAHGALHRWCNANGHRIGAHSWEIYGDWFDDESRLVTTIVYALV